MGGKKKQPERQMLRASRSPLAVESARRPRISYPNKDVLIRVNGRYQNPISGLKARSRREQRDRRKSKTVAIRRSNMHKQMIVHTNYPQLRMSRDHLMKQVHTDARRVEKTDKALGRSMSKNAIVLGALIDNGHILSRATWIKTLLVNAYNFRKKETLFLALDVAIFAFMYNIVSDMQALRDSGIRMIHSRHIRQIVNDIWNTRYGARPFSYLSDEMVRSKAAVRKRETKTADEQEDAEFDGTSAMRDAENEEDDHEDEEEEESEHNEDNDKEEASE